VDAAQISRISGWPVEPELVLLLFTELDLIVRADPCQARPVATNLAAPDQDARNRSRQVPRASRRSRLDELVLWVHPMLAGAGTPSDMLISDGLNTRLTLAGVKTFSSGVVICSYRSS
jgi:hypothetical protein